MSHCEGSDVLLGCGKCKYRFLESMPWHLTPDAAYAICSLYLRFVSDHREHPVSAIDTYATCAGKVRVRLYFAPRGMVGRFSSKVQLMTSTMRIMSSMGAWCFPEAYTEGPDSVPSNREAFREAYSECVVLSAGSPRRATKQARDIDISIENLNDAAVQAGINVPAHVNVALHKLGYKKHDTPEYK